MHRTEPMTPRKYFSRKLKGNAFHLCKQIRNSKYGNRWRYMNTGARTPIEETVYLFSELEIRKAVSCSFFKLTNGTHTSCKCCIISPLTLVTSFTLSIESCYSPCISNGKTQNILKKIYLRDSNL